MNKKWKALALLLGCTFALAAFAACAPKDDPGGDDPGITDPDDNTDPVEDGVAASYRICFDNVGGGYLDSSVTSVDVGNVTVVAGYNAAGTKVGDPSTIASYADGVFTAKSAGTVIYRGAGGALGSVEVVPAYVTDPGYQYQGNSRDFDEVNGEAVLGYTHDPSLIEVKDGDGRSVYYIFSTGWNNETSAVMGSMAGQLTYGNAIHVSYDGMKTWMLLGRTFAESTRDEDFVDARSGEWLYKEGGTSEETGTPNGYSEAEASWWAPDIVAKPDGSGYWLYTCVVDGAGDNEGMRVPGESGVYARACILLYESATLDAGTFKPVLDENGDPAVLMQSTIRRGESEKDVNGIDPQIIYDEDGKMYMAYGSFGSGNYLIELDPETGLRKDGKGWQSHDDIRDWVENDIQDLYNGTPAEGDTQAIGWEHDYYGKNISKQNMEAPVIARHDNVTVTDENGTVLEEGKTYYYSMHSYDGLGDNYQMWGGRSESVWGIYRSTTGGIVYNVGPGNGGNEGNKYMGAFTWHNKSAGNTELDIILPGHNDLFTTSGGVSVAAYITRRDGNNASFVTQIHQYYLNSFGEIVINPNRYGGEMDRAVSAEELFRFTEDGKFKMVVALNQRDTNSSYNAVNVSRDVTLTQNESDANSGDIYDGATATGTPIGSWKMYGDGYIKFTFTEPLRGSNGVSSGETVFYGVVRPAWLGDQNKSGFTITCLGQTEGNRRSMTMFMNNYSTMTGSGLVGE